MGTIKLRNELHQYIDSADDRLINLMYALVQADLKEEDYQLSKEHKKILDSRLATHEENPTSGSDWNEVKSRIEGQL